MSRSGRVLEALDAAFVTWFFTRDFDEQWLQQLAASPLAPTVRLWRDNGLYAGDGAPTSRPRRVAPGPRARA